MWDEESEFVLSGLQECTFRYGEVNQIVCQLVTQAYPLAIDLLHTLVGEEEIC